MKYPGKDYRKVVTLNPEKGAGRALCLQEPLIALPRRRWLVICLGTLLSKFWFAYVGPMQVQCYLKGDRKNVTVREPVRQKIDHKLISRSGGAPQNTPKCCRNPPETRAPSFVSFHRARNQPKTILAGHLS